MMAHPFLDPQAGSFRILFKEYGFRVTSSQYDADGSGSGLVRLETPAYFFVFHAAGTGPELTLSIGRTGQEETDLAWVFAYLTHSANRSPSAAAPWLYYFPHRSLRIWGEASLAWQMGRLADVLQCMWPAVFIFLDRDGPRSTDFLAFQQRAKRAAAERAEDGYLLPAGQVGARAALNFADQVEKSFAFLSAYGYKMTHAAPVFVRYESVPADGQRPTYVNIFHRLRSYQLGLQTGLKESDSNLEMNFDLEELAVWASIPYSASVVKSAAELPPALNRLARLYRKCAAPALAGDQRLYEALHVRRIDAARWASRAWAERNRR